MDVCLVIKRRLEELGLEQKDLATAAEVTDSYISQLLARKRLPPAPDRYQEFAHRCQGMTRNPELRKCLPEYRGDVDGNSIARGNDGRMEFTIAQTPAFVTASMAPD